MNYKLLLYNCVFNRYFQVYTVLITVQRMTDPTYVLDKLGYIFLRLLLLIKPSISRISWPSETWKALLPNTTSLVKHCPISAIQRSCIHLREYAVYAYYIRVMRYYHLNHSQLINFTEL